MSKRPYNIYQSDESFDILAELDDLDYNFGSYEKEALQDLVETDSREENPHFNKSSDSNGHLNNDNSQSIQIKRQSSPNNNFTHETYDSQYSPTEMEQRSNDQKDDPKHDKGKQYSKNYREKKKETMKSLEEENKFLKQKIDDLSFRLRQTELELNKLKHSQFSRRQNVQTIKQQYMKQIEQIFQNKEENKEKIREMEQKFTHLNTLGSKEKTDLLNYYRNEFFEILLSNVQFYLLDGSIEHRGLSRVSEKVSVSNIDLEVYEIYNIETFEELQVKKIIYPPYAMVQIRKYKQLIQNLYQDYCKVIAQGTLLEKMWQPPTSQLRASKVCSQTQNFLKLEIYFEKIRYRKDMREYRQSWFVDQEKQSQRHRSKSNKKSKRA